MKLTVPQGSMLGSPLSKNCSKDMFHDRSCDFACGHNFITGTLVHEFFLEGDVYLKVNLCRVRFTYHTSSSMVLLYASHAN